MEKINFLNFPNFTQEVVLDNVSYVLNFKWNSRFEFWAMSIANSLREPIVEGIKIVLNYELISKFAAYDVPPGEMYAFDPSGNTAKIQQNDFVNGRVSLVYITEEELEAL